MLSLLSFCAPRQGTDLLDDAREHVDDEGQRHGREEGLLGAGDLGLQWCHPVSIPILAFGKQLLGV